MKVARKIISRKIGGVIKLRQANIVKGYIRP
jgi:hypothetical protein